MSDYSLITNKNIRAYAERHVVPLLQPGMQLVDYDEIVANTQVNYVFRIGVSDHKSSSVFYIKQATGRLKTNGVEFPVDRVKYEALSLRKLRDLLGEGVVPEVLSYDDKNHVLVLSDIRKSGSLLIDEFEKGRIHAETAPRFGSLLGILHGKTLGTTDTIRSAEDELWIKNFIYEFKTSGAMKFAESEVRRLIAESESVPKSFLGVDFADKNIFVDGSDVRFCDFEAVFKGDPGFDVGHILAHYLLQAENDHSLTHDVAKFFCEFMRSYRQQMRMLGVSPKELQGIDERAVRYIGVFMLHRSHGKSPYTFFRPGLEERIKDDSLRLIHSESKTPENALLLVLDH